MFPDYWLRMLYHVKFEQPSLWRHFYYERGAPHHLRLSLPIMGTTMQRPPIAIMLPMWQSFHRTMQTSGKNVEYWLILGYNHAFICINLDSIWCGFRKNLSVLYWKIFFYFPWWSDINRHKNHYAILNYFWNWCGTLSTNFQNLGIQITPKYYKLMRLKCDM